MSRSGFLAGDSLELGGRHRLPHTGDDIDVTPLVDCVFLLLSFFMLTSSMEGNPDKNMPSAVNGAGVQAKIAQTIRISLTDAGPQVFLDGHESAVEDVRAFVQEGLERDKSLVVIKADRAVPHGFVQEVVRAVGTVEGVTCAIGVLDKKRE